MNEPKATTRQIAIPMFVEQLIYAKKQVAVWQARAELLEEIYKEAMKGGNKTLQQVVEGDERLRNSLLIRAKGS